jgi:hypothetical protein
MNTCPDEGGLRSTLDGATPHGASTAAVEHLRSCGHCTDRLTALGDDAGVAAQAIGLLEPDVDRIDDADDERRAGEALERLRRDRGERRGGSAARVAAGVVGILVIALGVALPGGRQAVADVLSSFRAERLQVVTVDPDQLQADFAALSELGEMRRQPPDPVMLDRLGEAVGIIGFTPSTVAPAPEGRQSIVATAPHTVEVEFSSAQVPDLPPDLDGAVLELQVPGMVMQSWDVAGGEISDGRNATGRIGEAGAPLPGVVVAEAGELRVDLRGAGLADLRAWLLTRPEVSPQLVDQLERITDWRTTLPIPLPAEGVAWRDARVGDHDALLFGDESGLAAAVVWQADGRIRGVGGMMSAADAQALAEAMQSP